MPDKMALSKRISEEIQMLPCRKRLLEQVRLPILVSAHEAHRPGTKILDWTAWVSKEA